jgi:ketosteroid isomerase-like protein
MSEESATAALVELAHRQLDAANRRDLDAFMSVFAPDGVYDTSPSGLGIYEGTRAIRSLIADWWRAFEELRFELEEIVDLGNGVAFAVVRQEGRPAGSTGYVKTREADVFTLVEGMIVRMTIYADVEEARAAADRLAESRG